MPELFIRLVRLWLAASLMLPAHRSTSIAAMSYSCLPQAYTSMGGNSLSVFPALSRMLPNWTIRYSGLGRLPWFNEHFKSININHSYKSVFAVGSYNSYSTFQEYMNGLGFVSDAATGNPSPSSMFNISQVSINESFSPLLGMDVTFNNNMTVKAEYRQTRVLNLSNDECAAERGIE